MIPFVDLKAQYASIKAEIDAAMAEVIRNTAFIGGPAVQRFERSFAEYCGAAHCVGASNGTSALHLALEAAGVQPGDEVLTVSHTFIATSETVRQLGAKVRFVEIDEQTYTMDPAALERALTPKVKAVIPVDLYGHPADWDALAAVTASKGIALIEDAAQAHGSRYRGRRAGSLAPIATFSFYPGKNLGAYGDAGAVTCASADQASKMQALANHGRAEKYTHNIEGYNYRLDGLQAAVLQTKLAHLDSWNAARRQAAKWYDARLAKLPGVVAPSVASWAEPVFHLYVVRVKERDRVLKGLKELGVEAGVHYPLPLHLQPAYAHLGYRRGEFPITERVADECLSLPMFAEITEEQVDRVVDALAKTL